MTLLGGMGTFVGPVLGAFTMVGCRTCSPTASARG